MPRLNIATNLQEQQQSLAGSDMTFGLAGLPGQHLGTQQALGGPGAVLDATGLVSQAHMASQLGLGMDSAGLQSLGNLGNLGLLSGMPQQHALTQGAGSFGRLAEGALQQRALQGVGANLINQFGQTRGVRLPLLWWPGPGLWFLSPAWIAC